jgi:integrase
MKWIKINKGIEARKHESRKNGVRFDRYFRGRYTVAGKTRTIGFGWESEGWSERKCVLELGSLKESAVKGDGPVTLREKRSLAEKQRNEEIQQAKKEDEKNLSFGQFFEETYWPVATSSKKATSFKKERQHFERWIKPVVGDLSFKMIGQIQAEKIKMKMQRKKLSPRSIQYVMSTFRQVWNLAKELGYTQEESPSKKVKISQPDNKRSRYLTDEESESLLLRLREKSELVYGMALVSLDTGGRFSEVAKLRWSHINGESLRFVDTKKSGGTKSRTIPLTSRLKEFFSSLPRKGSLVFPGRDGQVLTEISSIFRTVVKNMGLNEGVTDKRDRVVFHSLRHGYASRMIQAGVDFYVVKELLGHSVIQMTERYSHINNGTLTDAVRQMEKIEKGKKDKVVKLRKKININE